MATIEHTQPVTVHPSQPKGWLFRAYLRAVQVPFPLMLAYGIGLMGVPAVVADGIVAHAAPSSLSTWLIHVVLFPLHLATMLALLRILTHDVALFDVVTARHLDLSSAVSMTKLLESTSRRLWCLVALLITVVLLTQKQTPYNTGTSFTRDITSTAPARMHRRVPTPLPLPKTATRTTRPPGAQTVTTSTQSGNQRRPVATHVYKQHGFIWLRFAIYYALYGVSIWIIVHQCIVLNTRLGIYLIGLYRARRHDLGSVLNVLASDGCGGIAFIGNALMLGFAATMLQSTAVIIVYYGQYFTPVMQSVMWSLLVLIIVLHVPLFYAYPLWSIWRLVGEHIASVTSRVDEQLHKLAVMIRNGESPSVALKDAEQLIVWRDAAKKCRRIPFDATHNAIIAAIWVIQIVMTLFRDQIQAFVKSQL